MISFAYSEMTAFQGKRNLENFFKKNHIWPSKSRVFCLVLQQVAVTSNDVLLLPHKKKKKRESVSFFFFSYFNSQCFVSKLNDPYPCLCPCVPFADV